MGAAEAKAAILANKTALGIEFGSTRIKVVLVDDKNQPIASGGHEWHISMHHGADAKCTYRFQFYVIFCLHIPCHILITVLNACPDIIKAICPDTVFITIFPFMT